MFFVQKFIELLAAHFAFVHSSFLLISIPIRCCIIISADDFSTVLLKRETSFLENENFVLIGLQLCTSDFVTYYDY